MMNVYHQQLGPANAPRWVIRTSKNLYWAGEGWTAYRERALLFHDEREAGRLAGKIMKRLFEMTPKWNYRATVEVEVMGFKQPDLRDLKEHLWETQALDLVFTDSGPEASIVLSFVNWDSLTEGQP